VPFYLRTGKRMSKRYSEIAIYFRPVPHHIFPDSERDPESNKLVIRLQPDEKIQLYMNTKEPGPGGYRLKPVSLELSLHEINKEKSVGAYERLLMDVVRGNPTLFMSSEEVSAAWQWIDGISQGWQKYYKKPLPYPSKSIGPKAAQDLITTDHRMWNEDV